MKQHYRLTIWSLFSTDPDIVFKLTVAYPTVIRGENHGDTDE